MKPFRDVFAGFSSVESADDAIDALSRMFGDGCRVHVIDHGFQILIPYGGGPSRPFKGLLRERLLSGLPCEHANRWWTPLMDGDQPVFVICSASPIEDVGPVERDAIGLVMSRLRVQFERLERDRRRDSMSIAAEMQWDLLPVRADRGCGSAVAAMLEPAYEVAGDLFDYAFDGATWLYSLDGMGHGLAATTSGAVALAAIRNQRRSGNGLVDQFEAANRAVRSQSDGTRFVTGVGCCVSPDGSVTIVNAGHEPIRAVRAGVVSELDLHADPPLGVRSDHRYREVTVPALDIGDGLVLFSDGAPGVRDVDGEALGPSALNEILTNCWTDVALLSAHNVGDAVLGRSDGEVTDDITIVVLKRLDEHGG